ncbi:MAG: cysteine desulfurase [Bacteroidia bacterium]|jgi:cysteine desulfurase/selenocysteine lyase|nr:cysteine desulfurase [Bacteroidia bacterium]
MTSALQSIRQQFPILHQEVNGKPLIYFDNAATTQKPKQVIDALQHYYSLDNANIHRAAHTLAARSTQYFEETRKSIQQFIHAKEDAECIFTKGVTESINLVAQTWGRNNLKPGDEVLISAMEHHSNIVPWQMICAATGAALKVIPINDAGELLMDEFEKLLNHNTKMVACVWVSNALGTINPVKEIIQKAHAVGAKVLLDGAQACSHLEVDVQDLDCDFLTISSHKLYGPTGVGVLYGKREILEAMPPYQGGGEMIEEVTFEKTTYNQIPFKFEAGTPNIGDVIAFNEAIKFVNVMGKANMAAHEEQLLKHFISGLTAIDGVKLVGTAQHKISVQSFVLQQIHHFDVGMLLDANGIAVRTGHHCTQPLMKRLGLDGTVRASFAVYNTIDEIDVLLEALQKLSR